MVLRDFDLNHVYRDAACRFIGRIIFAIASKTARKYYQRDFRLKVGPAHTRDTDCFLIRLAAGIDALSHNMRDAHAAADIPTIRGFAAAALSARSTIPAVLLPFIGASRCAGRRLIDVDADGCAGDTDSSAGDIADIMRNYLKRHLTSRRAAGMDD